MENPKNKVTLTLPATATVYEDKKTHVKMVVLEFAFPDYHTGILSITKLVKLPWHPTQQIESVTINFKPQ